MEKSLSNVIIFLLLFFCSCTNSPYIEQPFEHYAKRYAKLHGIKLRSSIVFGKLSQPQFVGYCTNFGNGTARVEIDRGYWNRASTAQKELLIAHELNHCEFGAVHNERIMSDYVCPESIMYPDTFTEQQIIKCYLPNRQYYLENL
jgi:hypothetical protein